MDHERIELNINDDLEQYKAELWKGLSLEELKKACLVLLGTSLVFLFLRFVCYLPAVICLWVTMLLVTPMALLLFLRVQGLTLRVYGKRLWAARFDEPLCFVSDEVDLPKPVAKVSRKQKRTARRQERQEYQAHKKLLKERKKEDKAKAKKEKRNRQKGTKKHGNLS